MLILSRVCLGILGLYVVSALVPILRANHWLVRIWDFPRLQLLILGLCALAGILFLGQFSTKLKILTTLCFIIGLGFDAYRILPYSGIWKKETLTTSSGRKSRELNLLTVNVLQSNKNYQALLDLIEEQSPDVVFLVEVSRDWIHALRPLERLYPHVLLRPQENTYGVAFYSRFPTEKAEVRYLIADDVPSIFARLKLPSGDTIEVHGLHPKPPQIETKTTTNRDAELVTVAKSASKSPHPTVVFGDLNDVAWSHTTRLFRRISGLLDPRVGRGTYATFPAGIPFFHFPLDYVFSSEDWLLKKIEVLRNIGSDHYPVFISLVLDRSAQAQQEGPDKEPGDEEEAQKTVRKAQKESP